jgi:hypothetical protein
MKTNFIELRPDRLDLPLAPCACGRLSSAVITVGGDIPDDVGNLAIYVEYLDGGEKKRYTAAGTRHADGTFSVYLAPAYFPAASDALRYHVVGMDDRDNPRWLGSGVLRIFDNPADGSPVAPDIIPRNSYAYNPQTGLYYKIWAEVNELGEITLTTDQEGIAL